MESYSKAMFGRKEKVIIWSDENWSNRGNWLSTVEVKGLADVYVVRRRDVDIFPPNCARNIWCAIFQLFRKYDEPIRDGFMPRPSSEEAVLIHTDAFVIQKLTAVQKTT